jgi:hypothetical protein
MSDKPKKPADENSQPQGTVVVVGNFAEARKKKEYDEALKKILERASKLDW